MDDTIYIQHGWGSNLNQISTDEKTHTVIFIKDNKYYADVFLYGASAHFGPEDTEVALKMKIIEYLKEVRLVARVKSQQQLGMDALNACMYHYIESNNVASNKED